MRPRSCPLRGLSFWPIANPYPATCLPVNMRRLDAFSLMRRIIPRAAINRARAGRSTDEGTLYLGRRLPPPQSSLRSEPRYGAIGDPRADAPGGRRPRRSRPLGRDYPANTARRDRQRSQPWPPCQISARGSPLRAISHRDMRPPKGLGGTPLQARAKTRA